MPKREVTSAPWAPVPARAYTGKAPRARQHRAVGRLSAGSAQARPGCTRAAAGVGRRVRGARALCGSTFGFMFQYSDNCGCICDVSPLASSARGKYIKYNIAYRPEDQEENTSGHYR